MRYLSSQKPTLKTFQQAALYFADPKNCIDYVVRERWPNGVITCPNCGCTDITFLPTRQLFQCKNRHPKRQFSVKVGTIFEDSPLPLGKWLLIMWMLVTCRNGISSYEVARTIGITQKSAWFMLHRLRVAMVDETWTLSGVCEADETYIGGLPKNKHAKKRQQKAKAPVIGVVERGGRVAAMAVQEATRYEAHQLIEGSVEKGALVISDDHAIYDKLPAIGYDHEIINHKEERFARGRVNTNSIENFWSCLKRMLKGTYISVTPKHLNAYVTEQAFRFNVRHGFTEQQRGFVLLHGIVGKRLTYADLTARPA